jgi:RNA polymerase sigma-70 factor (ECF subfamily)
MTPMDDAQVDAVVTAAQAGDEAAFGRLVERFGPELKVHCYRMLGSLDDAEDTVQDVFLHAWRALAGFERRASVRTWLYRIATHACLARRTRDQRRRRLAAIPRDVPRDLPLAMTVPWLQACPDDLLDRAAAHDPDPASTLAARETVEITFVAALQHLPDRQRAAVVLRDVVGWPADRCAEALGTTVPAVNSALQRARSTLRTQLGDSRDDWRASPTVTVEERALVRRYIDAIESSDDAAIAALLDEDVVVAHQPGAGGHDGAEPAWYQGRSTVIEAWAPALHSPQPLDMRMVEARANRQPAVASYIRVPGRAEHRAFALSLLGTRGGRVTEIANLLPDQLPSFGLPVSFTARG